ncbi:MAG: hypothetical protein JWN40_2809, partial [Phycisphaerales bacterium]|nr:hypothetical protein [Phycisphaerales bacterium]
MTFSNRCAIALFWLSCCLTAGAAEPGRELWVYYPTNLLVDQNVDKLRQIWGRAAGAGYTHVLLADSKFSRLGAMDKRYFANVERTKQIAAELKLTIVPALFPVGYSNDLLANDPNLAEGLPVKDALFVVKDNVAQLKAEGGVAFRAKFDFVDEGIKVDQAERVATVSDNAANARLNQKMKLTPYRHYHVSVQVKTEGYTGHPEIKALTADGVSLNWTNLHVKPTQDWTTHHVTFNSLAHTDVAVYLGVWGAAKGTLRWKDWKIEEVGLLNVLRRDGAPLTVRAGEKRLVEGTDFEAIKDPRMGMVPWAGGYEVFHESPGIHTKGLADGTELRVSWYHPHVVYDEQMACCLAEPKVKEILTDQAQRMRKLWNAPGYMMSHDENRVCNQDEACLKTGKTPGELLAENARFCTRLLEGATVYAWNDMFDPFHNAVKGPYYLVNGAYTDSWVGLDKSVVIMNWNFGKRDQSL